MNSSRTTTSPASFLPAIVGLIVIGLVCWFFWATRPAWHGLVMFVYQYPLLTWVPVLGFAVLTAAFCGLVYVVADKRSRDEWYGPAVLIAFTITCIFWIVACIFQPSWSGRDLYNAQQYTDVPTLPMTSQPRILPKTAATEYGEREGMKHAHLVINAQTGRLSWTAEKAPGGLFNSGSSKQVAVMPLDRIDGSMERSSNGFKTAVSSSSVPWQHYKKHYFTRLQERNIVPLGNGKFVAVMPYIAYKGFFVKHPYWAGIIVLHQDGKREDLTPEQALSRRELAASGRLYPEKLARSVAQAYGYKNGISNTISGHKDQSQIKDPDSSAYYRAAGNPQPYLTRVDGSTYWVTVGSPHGDENHISKVFLTNSSTGKTSVWAAPKNRLLLSNTGAYKIAYGIRETDGKPVDWVEENICCDADGYRYDHTKRWITEPRPVFSRGQFYYLLSVIGDQKYVKTREPVERTVIVNASEGNVVAVYNHETDPEADTKLRAFFAAK